MTTRSATLTLTLTSCMTLCAALPSAARVQADFNADGYDDLAIGIPYYDLRAGTDDEAPGAGQVTVLYGGPAGLSAVDSETWNQDLLPGARGEDWDRFGDALAAGDFDCDGFVDLAIGAPTEDIGQTDTIRDAGMIHILYGSLVGLEHRGEGPLTMAANGLPGLNSRDRFGDVLEAGNFDNDLCDDLVVGLPNADLPGVYGGGSVVVLYGSVDGLQSIGSDEWHQDSTGTRDVAEDYDHFGSAVAVGDFDGDGVDDLAIGAPREDLREDKPNPAYSTGIVHVLFGSAGGGLSALDNQRWTQQTAGVDGNAEPYDRFGAALAAGDLDNDGHDDLVVGSPGETLADHQPEPIYYAGMINVFYGSAAGLTVEGNRKIHQDSAGIFETAASYEYFGEAITIGNFDDDAYEDVAVGVPDETLERGAETIYDAGLVHVFYGGPSGIGATRNEIWTEDSPGVPDKAEDFDMFGFALTSGDFNGDGYPELAVGIPYEYVGYEWGAGAIVTIDGGPNGLTGLSSRWTQGTAGIDGAVQAGEKFGLRLR